MRGWTKLLAGVGLAALVVGSLGACASIMQGTTQSVGISSTPTGAKVSVDGKEYGETPVVADLKRKDNHLVHVELDGYQPYEAALSRSVSGWVAGNIIFGGLIGLAVDAITGGMYKLTPEQVNGSLAATSGSPSAGEDGLYLFVVLRPDPSWQRIGSLTRK